ncbi:MAG: methenyltetrahydromethanopterin cyclohydrolase [Planctomycetes bacterium RBG_16_64_10]|nr:MAG: methenyltetrahydromethanopterin cyclohydrolase [Planctomycetes bacterium RBG_16_64_10]
MHLNRRALRLCQRLVRAAGLARIKVEARPGQARLVDCGVHAPGGLAAGWWLARISLAGLARVALVPADPALGTGLAVMLSTDHPVLACLASQYAGWRVTDQDYFAMLSGPIRAVAGQEALFDSIGHRETARAVVGVLESDRLPPVGVCDGLAARCGIAVDRLTLLVAPITSQAGTIQVVGRSVETALHKLHLLGFDLGRIESATGVAPLPPVAADPIVGIGRSNDAIIYGGQVTLYVRGDDASLVATGAQVPSCASPDYGAPFADLFRRYDHDFYRVDPHLFSPAVIVLVNLDTGHSFRFGCLAPEVLRSSFSC